MNALGSTKRTHSTSTLVNMLWYVQLHDSLLIHTLTRSQGAVGTIASWFLMPHFGRRTLYLWGLGFLFCMLMLIGGMGVLGTARGPSLAAGTLLMIYTFVYDFTIGPVCYALVADIPSTRLKIKTVVLARNLYNVGGIINNVLMPRMLLNTNWNWGARTGFFWAGACLLLFIYHYFRLPEPKVRNMINLQAIVLTNLTRVAPMANLMSSSRIVSVRGSSARPRSINLLVILLNSTPMLIAATARRGTRRLLLRSKVFTEWFHIHRVALVALPHLPISNDRIFESTSCIFCAFFGLRSERDLISLHVEMLVYAHYLHEPASNMPKRGLNEQISCPRPIMRRRSPPPHPHCLSVYRIDGFGPIT
jgi:hypothetical protein